MKGGRPVYERMLDKAHEPSRPEIEESLGGESCARLQTLEDALAARYRLSRQLCFPFGKGYGWGYKYGHQSAHLCHAFFERGAFTVMIQVGDKRTPALEDALKVMTPKARALWATRYPCGDVGGWVQYRVLDDADLADAIGFIEAKKPPANRARTNE